METPARSSANSPPSRDRLSAAMTWDLSGLYADQDAWEADFAELPMLTAAAKSFQGRLGEGAGVVATAFAALDELGRLAEKLHVYAHLRSDEDTTNGGARGVLERVGAKSAEIAAATAWFEPEMLNLGDDVLATYRRAPELEFYWRSIDDIIRDQPHTLSAPEERLLGAFSDALGSPEDIYSILHDADMRFPRVSDAEGNRFELTHGNFVKFMESPCREVRATAFKAMYKTYRKLSRTYAAILGGTVKANVVEAQTRGFPSALAAALHPDKVPTGVYDNLVATVRRRLPDFHRYLELRRRVLKLEQLEMFDILNPLLPETRVEIPWKKAQLLVEAAFEPLGGAYVDTVRRAFSERWIDVPECRGKRSGAYSSGCYDSKPFILLNYQGTLNDVFTLAHELGHSLHSWHSNRHQPYHYAGYPIFLAEVASITNELLLHHHLLAGEDDPRQRASLLNHLADEIRGTVFRQTMFAEFERDIHAAVEDERPLTSESLCQGYRQLNRHYHGATVADNPMIAVEWARIPHFHYEFYVYKYATGFCAAAALAKGIIAGHAECVGRYLDFLKAGDSADPLDILRHAGVDMESPAPVEAAMDKFAVTVADMETLLDGIQTSPYVEST